MGRTRLWQNAGSTLIQGSSKRQKPFRVDWFVAAAVSAVVSCGLIVGIMVYQGAEAADALSLVWLPVIFGSGLGPIPGIWIAGKYGSLRRWPVGAAMGVLLSLVSAWWFVTYLAT